MYSRRQTLEEKRNKRKAIFLFAITIILLTSVIYFGIPLVVRYTGFLSTIKSGSDPVENNDTTPPAPPRLDSLPESTKDTSIDVNGSTEEGATVVLTINGKREEVIANKSGRFSYNMKLNNGTNTISVYAKDLSGNESQKVETQIVFDNEEPKIELITPTDGQNFYGSSSKLIYVEGSTEKEAHVLVNDKLAVVDDEGKFKKQITLSEGDNEIIIKAEDRASNLAEIKITVKYTP